MKQKEIDTIKKLLSSSCRGDHMVGLALLTKNRSVKRLIKFWDKHALEHCYTIDYLHNKAWAIKSSGKEDMNVVRYHYESKKFGFYVGTETVYLVLPNHRHKDSWNSINI